MRYLLILLLILLPINSYSSDEEELYQGLINFYLLKTNDQLTSEIFYLAMILAYEKDEDIKQKMKIKQEIFTCTSVVLEDMQLWLDKKNRYVIPHIDRFEAEKRVCLTKMKDREFSHQVYDKLLQLTKTNTSLTFSPKECMEYLQKYSTIPDEFIKSVCAK